MMERATTTRAMVAKSRQDKEGDGDSSMTTATARMRGWAREDNKGGSEGEGMVTWRGRGKRDRQRPTEKENRSDPLDLSNCSANQPSRGVYRATMTRNPSARAQITAEKCGYVVEFESAESARYVPGEMPRANCTKKSLDMWVSVIARR
jgi:hypothetical protein